MHSEASDRGKVDLIRHVLCQTQSSHPERLVARVARVVSLAYGANNNFLDYGHPNFSCDEQMSIVRSSFRDSAGETIMLPCYQFEDARVMYAGAWSRVESSASRLAAEFTTGAVSGLVGTTLRATPDPSSFAIAPEFNDGAAVISDSGYNIHHFIWEHLPAIHLYRDVVTERGRLLVGVSDEGRNSFVRPLLRLAGLKVDVATLPLHSTVSLSETAVIGTFPFRVYPVELVTEVRDQVLANLSAQRATPLANASDVIFLGRGDAERNRRRLGNESAVLEALRDKWPNFTTIRSALTPLSHTIEVMRDCRILVGPTGGALAHALWATKLEHVVELVPGDFPGTTETEEASQFFSFRYHRVTMHRQDTTDVRKWSSADYDAEIDVLKEVLRDIVM